MRPHVQTVPAGQRVVYASFAVPHEHVAGEFQLATLTLEGGRRFLGDRFIDRDAK